MVCAPVFLFAPFLLVPHNVDDLPVQLVLTLSHSARINKHKTPSLDPNGGAKARRQLDEQHLGGGKFDAVQVVASGLLDTSD